MITQGSVDLEDELYAEAAGKSRMSKPEKLETASPTAEKRGSEMLLTGKDHPPIPPG
jgi:hypothetical protein